MPGILLAALVAALAAGGCASPPNSRQAGLSRDDPGQRIAPAELDELTRAFADRYVGLISSACDALKKDNLDPVQRREAQELMLNEATNVYDIASNADAFTRMLDLVVVTTLVSQVWIDDDRAEEVFGGRSQILVRALHHGRVEAWALAAQVLRPDQLDLLDYLIWDWRRHNPDMVRASFVRFSNFAVGRGRSADAEVVAAGGFFPNIGQAGQSIDEARLLTERMFYMLKRYPTLLGWETAAMKEDLIATPEVGTALADVHRLTDQIEKMPRNVAAERQAILLAFDERMRSADTALTKLRGGMTDARGLVADVGRTGSSLRKMLGSADSLFVRFDAWDRWSADLPGHRSFDVREYSRTMEKMNELIKSSNELLASASWGSRVKEVNQAADGRINIAFEQSQRVVNAIFLRVCLAIALFFAILILYRIGIRLLARGSRGSPGDEHVDDQRAARVEQRRRGEELPS